jgi:thioredoxin 1
MMDETPERDPDSVPRHAARDGIRTVTSSTFKPLVLEGEGPIAVEFMSYGCAHCRAIEPALQHVAELLKAKEKIFKVNIAAEPTLAEYFQVSGTPTFVMFLNGQEAGRAAGPQPSVSSVLAVVTEPFE